MQLDQQIESDPGRSTSRQRRRRLEAFARARPTMETCRFIIEVDFFAPSLLAGGRSRDGQRGSDKSLSPGALPVNTSTPLRTGYPRRSTRCTATTIHWAEVAKGGVIVTTLVVGAVHTRIDNALSRDGAAYGIINDAGDGTGGDAPQADGRGIIAGEPKCSSRKA